MAKHVLLLGLLISGSFTLTTCTDRGAPEKEKRAGLAFEKAKSTLARGDHLEGRRLLNEIVTLDEGTNRMSRRAEVSLLLAENYAAGAEFEIAEPLYRQALRLYAELGDKAGARAATFALASNAHLRGDDNAAFELLTQAIHLAEALGEVDGVRELKWALIPVARAIGDIELENKTLNELLSGYAEVRDLVHQARVSQEMGRAAMARGRMTSALPHFLNARELAERSGNSLLVIELLKQCAVVSDRIGKPAEALRLFADALRRTDVTQGSSSLREEMLMRVGNIYLRQRRYDDAKRFMNAALRAAIKSQNKLVEAYALIQMSHCVATPTSDTRKALQAGAELVHAIGLPWANAFAFASLGDDASKSNRINEALDHYRSAVASDDSSYVRRDEYDVYTDCEQTVYGQYKSYAFQALIDLLCRLSKTEDAFVAAGENDRREFRRQFGGLLLRTRNRLLDASFETFFRVRCDYAGTEQKLLDVVTKRSESRTLTENVQQSLRRACARIRDVADSICFLNKQYSVLLQPDAASTSETRRALPPGSVAVRYVPTMTSLYIFIITEQQVGVEVSAVGRDQLIALILDHNLSLQKGAETNEPSSNMRVTDLSSKLYQMFLRPLEKHIAPSSTLHIMLPNDMPLIALHSLRRLGSHSPYAIEQHSFRYMSIAGFSSSKPSPFRPPQSTVIFGNAGNTSWDVEYELRDIKAFVREARLYFNRDASLAAFQKEEGELLHCALDVRFNHLNPGSSYIVFSDGRGYTTAVYARFGELFAIAPFSTAIVSNLSVQPLHVSLPTILQINGTENVIINGVAATRKAKKLFNEVFYTLLMAGNSPPVAYRNTLLQMMKDTECAAAPGMWAPIFLW